MIQIKKNINWLVQQSTNYQDSCAIKSSKLSLTYEELYEEVKIWAAFFAEKNINRGERVAILAGHDEKFIYAVNALWLIGAVPVPLNTRLSKNEIKQQLEFAEIKILLTDNPEETFNHCKIISLTPPAGNTNYDKFIIEIDPVDTGLILFTSGSTSQPKAVELSFENLFSSAEAIAEELNFSSKESFLASLPLYHIGGFSMISRSLITGGTLVIPESLKAEKIYESIIQKKTTVASVVPTTLKRFLDAGYKPPISLQYLFLGGGPMPHSVILSALNKGWNIYIVYGSTETCSMVTLLKKDEIEKSVSCAGKPIHQNKIIIQTPQGQVLRANQEGIVVIKSNSVSRGYLKNVDSQNSENIYISDDLGFLNNEGYLYITGRRDDIIISGGENINCREVDKHLKEHSIIKDCFSFGLDDAEWGQLLCSAICVEEKQKINRHELNTFLKKKIANYKIPKKYFIVDKVERNELGKVNKSKLMETIFTQ